MDISRFNKSAGEFRNINHFRFILKRKETFLCSTPIRDSDNLVFLVIGKLKVIKEKLGKNYCGPTPAVL